MLTRITLVLALCTLIAACSGPGVEEQATVIEENVPATGPLTVNAPDGVEIAATVHSIGEPTVVLVHGWMCDQTYWELQLSALVEHFGVVTVDVAGHGLSGTDRQVWTTSSLGDDVAAVINHLDLKDVVVVGHSMGGRVALEVARLVPGRVVGVIGVDTLHNAENTMDPEEAEAFLAGVEKDFAAACDPLVRSMFRDGADTILMDRVASDMCGGPGEIGTALLRDYIEFDVAAALQNAAVPVRCVNSDQWPTNPEANRKYADFEATILPGYGHFLMQEAPEELNQALIETVNAIGAGGPDQ